MIVACLLFSMTFPKVLDLNFFIGDLHRQVSIAEVSFMSLFWLSPAKG